jgi:hypothetical protein
LIVPRTTRRSPFLSTKCVASPHCDCISLQNVPVAVTPAHRLS